MRLKLPIADRVVLAAKKSWVWVLLAVILLLGLLLVFISRIDLAKRLWLKWIIRSREHQLEVLDREEKANQAVVEKEEVIQLKLHQEKKKVERELTEAQLRVDGMSDEDVIAELRRRGF